MHSTAGPPSTTCSPPSWPAASGPTSTRTPRWAARPRPTDVAELAAITAAGLGVDGALRLVDDVLLPNNVALDHRAVPRLHPGRAGDDRGPVRRCRRRVVVLRRELAGGGRGRGRRERRARLAARGSPACPTTAAGCFVSRRVGGQPQRARRRPRRVAASPPRRRSAGRGLRAVGPLVGARRGRAARPRRRRGRRRRARPADRRPRCATRSATGGVRRRGQRRRHQHRRRRRARRRRRRLRRRRGSGSTSTPPTAAPRCACPSWPGASPGSSGPTRSSSIRTSGCSPRSTAPPCCTAIPRPRPAPTASRRRTSTRSATTSVNPSDLAFHLTRRARGLPFWFALVVHGTDAYADGGARRRRPGPAGGGDDRGASATRCAW